MEIKTGLALSGWDVLVLSGAFWLLSWLSQVHTVRLALSGLLFQAHMLRLAFRLFFLEDAWVFGLQLLAFPNGWHFLWVGTLGKA